MTDVLSQADVDWVRGLLRERAGLELSPDKAYLVEGRVHEVARRHDLGSPKELVARLRSTPVDALHWDLIEAHTINETSFFRASHVFEHLASDVLPDLIEARRRREQLRIWSAACSTGQEAYSLAMLLRERFPELARWDVQIVASDLSRSALRRVDAGLYTAMEMRRGVPDHLRSRYFSPVGPDWRVAYTLRQMVRTERINLTAPLPRSLPTFDLVLLRNVLIYFDSPTRRDVLARIGEHAAADAVLLLGETETSLDPDVPFARVTATRAVHYRMGAPSAPSFRDAQPGTIPADRPLDHGSRGSLAVGRGRPT